MITRITGVLESLEKHSGVIVPGGRAGGIAYEVLLPAYMLVHLQERVGQTVTLVTLEYLEGQGQGTSFVPRLVGFGGVKEREFFDLLTTVKGIGNRKALRALAVEPGAIAAAIQAKDAKSLTRLPEVGKRLAETMIAELSGKVEAFLAPGEAARLDGAAEVKLVPAAEQAVAALVALGETRAGGERLVSIAMQKLTQGGRAVRSAGEILDEVYAGEHRGRD